mgnify:CR=1 FL=1
MRELWFDSSDEARNDLWFNAVDNEPRPVHPDDVNEMRKPIDIGTGPTIPPPPYKEENPDQETGADPRYPTKPIGSFQLCCLWGCDECEWTWGGGGRWIHKDTGIIHRR